MHITVFEYGYLSCDKSACDELGAELISSRAYNYLKDVCLSASESNTAKCLGLTKRYGYELIQVKNYVGVLFTPTGEHIEVLPKTGRTAATNKQAVAESRQILLMMLQHLGVFRYVATNQANVVSKQMPLLEVFISQFLQAVNRLVKRGLKSDYLRQQANLHFQKGKLNVSKQLRHNLVSQHKFYVEYDEYLLNRPANRLIKTALIKLASYTRLASHQKLLRELQFAFMDVPSSTSIKQDISALKLDRTMVDYYSPIAWAKLILEGFSPLSMKGQDSALSLLFPMEAVFESYVASVLGQHISNHPLSDEFELLTQARSCHLVEHHEQQWFQLKPDLLIKQGEKNVCVLDTKWKVLDQSKDNGSDKYGLSQADFYQMFAYGQKYLNGQGNMFLIYPANDKFQTPIEQSFKFSAQLTLWVVPFYLDLEGNSVLQLPNSLDPEMQKLISLLTPAREQQLVR
ncbi:McrC family protein [Agarivorans litoreus]|uniref:McrC family protein n=1 Tax=Agarivorans litoreus TaxID=1510455 RepID=UPI001C7DE9FA|nr:McrC family protein [Agarivorans litoreus]